MSVYIGIVLDEGLERYIAPMLATGLYGADAEDLVVSLVREGVIRAVIGKIVDLHLDPEFADVGPWVDPGLPEAGETFVHGVRQPPPPKCSVCNDSDDLPKACEACGNLGIPF